MAEFYNICKFFSYKFVIVTILCKFIYFSNFSNHMFGFQYFYTISNKKQPGLPFAFGVVTKRNFRLLPIGYSIILLWQNGLQGGGKICAQLFCMFQILIIWNKGYAVTVAKHLHF